MTGLEVSELARLHVGTPYAHQGRLKGVGEDCVGLLINVGKEAGFVPEEWESSVYSTEPSGEELDAEIRLWCDETPFEATPAGLTGAQPGDVLVIESSGTPTHTAFVSRLPDFSLGMIHASRSTKAVVEHRIGGKWPSRVVKAFRPRGLE